MKDDVAVLCRDVLTLCGGCNCAFDNDYQFCCMLAKNHSGPHYDEFENGDNTVAVVWHSEKFAVSLAGENAA